LKKAVYIILLFCTSCASTRLTSTNDNVSIQQTYINDVAHQFAPDKRTALFQVTAKGNILSGETNIPAAKGALLQKLTSVNIRFIDSIIVLPSQDLQGKNYGVVSVSVANLRIQPGHPFELVTQATLGTPLQVYKKDKGWYLVQTPDKYIAWVEGGSIALFDSIGLSKWKQSDKLLYTQPYGIAYASTNRQGATVSDLVYGDVLNINNQTDDFFEVSFPDGRTAFIAKSEGTKLADWSKTRQPTEDNLIQSAKKLMGVPYLWGGTSFKGVDCSGFTKTVYLMNGLVLPRDASQQVSIGEEVDTKNGWQSLRPGDLLFFGMPARDGNPERVIHVGMWIGGPNNEFIQSSSMVKISSFNPGAPNYDAHGHQRFLRAKRITPQDALFDLRKTSIFN